MPTGHKIAIDLGTTNTVVAQWQTEQEQAQVLSMPGISIDDDDLRPPLIPSLLYVQNGETGAVTIGQAVRTQNLDVQRDNRLFRNFKRGIVAATTPDPRLIDGQNWGDHAAGRSFVRTLIEALPYPQDAIEQLVLTAPVASFEGYLAWLNDVMPDMPDEKIRIVDESTAAALGYMVTKPGAVVLVFDFGGGTLDLSLVQLPEHREKTGGFLRKLLRANAAQHSARVIAKAGRIIGGSDVDQWLLADVLKRINLTTKDLGDGYPRLLTACELAKIALSTDETTAIQFEDARGQAHSITYQRAELEALLQANGFFSALRRVVDKVMHVARQRGIFKEDIHYVLMVGGMSLMPSVQRTLGEYFTDMAVRADRPFTAVAEGALQVAAGFGLEDYLIHSYGLRHLDESTGAHQYDEIIPMGSRYPTEEAIEVILGAAHANQVAIEFVIGEIDSDAVAMIEVQYENGQAVFVAQTNESAQQVVPLNEADALNILAHLKPQGQPGQDRVVARFRIDDRRRLRVSVTDLQPDQPLLNDVVVTTLR
jgi:molecular chaperone DnaK (HSP70)